MIKHSIQFINNHIDLLQVTGAGIGGVWVMLTDMELILKCSIGLASLGYILWKWRVEYLKNKQ